MAICGSFMPLASAQQAPLEAYNKERDARIAAEKARDSVIYILKTKSAMLDQLQKADSEKKIQISYLKDRLKESDKQIKNAVLLADKLRKTEEAFAREKKENQLKVKVLAAENEQLKAQLKNSEEKIGDNSKVVTEYKKRLDKEIEANFKLKKDLEEAKALSADPMKEISRLKEALALAKQVAKAEKTEREKAYFERNKIKVALGGHLEFAVNYLINSSDYNVPKTDELMVLCKATDEDLVANLPKMKTSLEQYKKLCVAMNGAKEALASQYEAARVTAARSLLATAVTSNAKQQQDIARYTSLLSGYCQATQRCYERFERAETFLPNLPQNAVKVMTKTLVEIEYGYVYLRDHLKQKQANPTENRTNPFPACK